MLSRAWSNGRGALPKIYSFLWGLVAVALGLTAQTFLARDHIVQADLLYGVAVVLIIYALRREPGPVAPAMPLEKAPPHPIYHRLALALVAFAGLLALLALTRFPSEPTPPSAWLLYMGSLVLFIVAAFLADRGQGETPGERRWSPIELGLLLLIIAVAALLRLWDLNSLPFGTWYDEAQNGLEALQILEDPIYRPVYAPRVNSTGHYLYLLAMSLRLFGTSAQAIRIVSAVMGVAAVAAAYLTGRELFNRRMGLVLAFLLAVSRWHVNFSRIGMYNVSTPLFELVAIGFLLRGLRRQRLTDFTWAGLALGLGMVFYVGFLPFCIVVIFFLLHLALGERSLMRRSWRGLLVFGLAMVLTIAPIAQFALRHPEQFWWRTSKTSVFTGKTLEQAWEDIRQSADKHLAMFNYRGDSYGRHNLPGEPMLDPATGALMILGIGVCLWRGWRPRSLLLPVWLGVMLCPGIFSLAWEAPQALRTIGSLPAAYLLATVPVDGLWREWERGVAQRYTRYFALPLLLLLGQIGYANYHIYFELQARDFRSWRDFSTAETITARLMAELGDSVEFYVISLYHSHPTVRLLAPNVTQYHRIETDDSLPLPGPTNKDVVLILDPERRSLYEDAQRYFPSATFEEYKPPDGGAIVLYLVRLTQADMTGIQGLEGSYYRGNAWAGEPALTRRDASLRFDWQDGAPTPLPFSVEWKGVLHAAEYGSYRLILRAPAHAELLVDEVLLLAGEGELSTEVSLAKGNHALCLRAVGAQGYFELAWQPPGEEVQTLPPWALYVPPVTNNGLLGRYYPNDQWRPPIALARIDRRLNLYFHVTPLPQPYTVEWEGKIFISQSGTYIFGLESIDESVLYIDGQKVTASRLRGQYREGSVYLQNGLHDILVRFADRTDHTHIYLHWIPPLGTREIVPAEVLFPPQGSYEGLAVPFSSGSTKTPATANDPTH